MLSSWILAADSDGSDESNEPFEATTSQELPQFRQAFPAFPGVRLASAKRCLQLQEVAQSRPAATIGTELALRKHGLDTNLAGGPT